MFSFVVRPGGRVAVYWRRELVCVIKDQEVAREMFATALRDVSSLSSTPGGTASE